MLRRARALLVAAAVCGSAAAIPIEHVVITNGAMQGLQLSAQGLARPGSAVALEEFEYSGTIRVFKQFGLELLGVPLDEHGMLMDALAEILAHQARIGKLPAFIYTTASYQNPTGATLPAVARNKSSSVRPGFANTCAMTMSRLPAAIAVKSARRESSIN